MYNQQKKLINIENTGEKETFAQGDTVFFMQVHSCSKRKHTLMKNDDTCYSQHLKILQEELIPAMGCTEPIAIAYGASKARAILGSCRKRLTCRLRQT